MTYCPDGGAVVYPLYWLVAADLVLSGRGGGTACLDSVGNGGGTAVLGPTAAKALMDFSY